MENEQKPSKNWLNTVYGKAFLTGMIMPIGCILTSIVLQPLTDNADISSSLFSLAGLLLMTAGVFAVFQLILKRRGFEGFNLIDKGSFGESGAYLMFFLGAVVSIALIFFVVIVVVFVANYLRML